MSVASRSLWPADLKTDDVRTPQELLNEQAQLLESQTNGLLLGRVVEHVAEDRRVLALEVTAPRIEKTLRLFEVLQSLEREYPVSIVPPNVPIPDFLQREVYHPSPSEIIGMIPDLANLTSRGQLTKNEWVADTPAEFIKKLEILLSSTGVKAVLYSLLARSKQAAPDSKPATE